MGMEPIKPAVSYDEFSKVDLRVGKIISAEDVPDADKLVKLSVDVGVEKLQMVAGVKKQYKPSDLAGKNIIVVANLAPKTLRGIESRGMILAVDEAGKPTVLFTDPAILPGNIVR